MPLPPHPFHDASLLRTDHEIRQTYESKDDISKCTKKLVRTTQDVGSLRRSERVQWHHNNRKRYIEITKETRRQERLSEACAQEITGVQESVKELRLELNLDAKKRSEEVQTTKEIKRRTIQEVSSVFRTLIELHGISIADSAWHVVNSKNDEKHPSRFPAQNLPSESSIPPQILKAIQDHIPNGNSSAEYTITTVVELLENTGARIRSAQSEIALLKRLAPETERQAYLEKRQAAESQMPWENSSQVPQSSQAMEYLRAPTSKACQAAATKVSVSKQLPPFKPLKPLAIPTKNGTSRRTPPNSRESTTTSSTGDSSQDSDTTASTPPDEDQHTDIVQVLIEHRRVEDRASRLETSVATLKEELETANREVRSLKTTLVRNYVYQKQIDHESCVGMTWILWKTSTVPQFVPTTFQLRDQVLLADDFDNAPLRPRGFSMTYLQSLIEDVAHFDPHDLIHVKEGKLITDQHMLWLSTNVRNALLTNTGQHFRMLHAYLSIVIRGDLTPDGLGLSALFMTIATITQATVRQSPSDIWFDMWDLLKTGSLGYPYTSWDMLQRVTFAWFMASAGGVALDDLELNTPQREALELLINSLQFQQPLDMVDLLGRREVQDLIKHEDSDYTKGSQLLVIPSGHAEEMVIVRTGDSTQPEREYMWVRHNGKVWFSDRGLSIRVTEDAAGTPSLEIWPVNGARGLPTFQISSDDGRILNYLNTYHYLEFLSAMEEVIDATSDISAIIDYS